MGGVQRGDDGLLDLGPGKSVAGRSQRGQGEVVRLQFAPLQVQAQ